MPRTERRAGPSITIDRAAAAGVRCGNHDSSEARDRPQYASVHQGTNRHCRLSSGGHGTTVAPAHIATDMSRYQAPTRLALLFRWRFSVPRLHRGRKDEARSKNAPRSSSTKPLIVRKLRLAIALLLNDPDYAFQAATLGTIVSRSVS
jgi:hypothetical protein